MTNAEGGGIYLFGCDVVIDNSTFYGNSASSKGGGIFTSNSHLKIINASIVKNSAGHVGGGGIVAQTKCSLHVSDSQLQTNHGGYGALFASDDTNKTLNNVDFYKNFAVLSGGAIGIESNSVMVATECRFSNNVALKTSIVSVYDNSRLTLKKSTINNNICGRLTHLDGFTCIDAEESDLFLETCLLQGNEAGINGGPIQVTSGQIRVSNSTFISQERDQQQDIYLAEERKKRMKFYTYKTIFKHDSTIIKSSDADFEEEAYKQDVLQLSGTTVLELRESPYASGIYLSYFGSTFASSIDITLHKIIGSWLPPAWGRYCFQFVCQFSPGRGGKRNQVPDGGLPPSGQWEVPQSG